MLPLLVFLTFLLTSIFIYLKMEKRVAITIYRSNVMSLVWWKNVCKSNTFKILSKTMTGLYSMYLRMKNYRINKNLEKMQVSTSILRNVLSEQYKCLYGNCLANLHLKVSNIGEYWVYIQGYDPRLQQHLYIET